MRNELQIVTADGQRHTEALPPTTLRDNQVALSVFDWEQWWVWSRPVRGDMFASEAYSPMNTDKGRPAVYLDQNHWSTLAWARVDPSKVKNQDELAAAQRMSAGWQLRSPLTVWGNELAAMLAGYEHVPIPPSTKMPVVTLEPQAWSSSSPHAHEIDNDLELFQLVLTEPSVILSTLIDTTPSQRSEASAWVERNRQITELFTAEELTDAERRRRATGLFWCENIQELERRCHGRC